MDRRRGYLCGLLSAALFGLSPPLCKLMLGQVAPVMMAGWLYLAGGVALTIVLLLRRLHGRAEQEARLQKKDAPLLLGIVMLGGIAGPVLMLLGLQRLSGFAGSLLLNLEAPLTMTLAVLVFREHLSKKELVAAAIITAAAALFAIGALGYGASLVLDSYALRVLGAAREAAIFSAAPFIGALGALALLEERPQAWQLAGAR